MMTSNDQWNYNFKVLKELLKKPEENIDKIKNLVIELHAYTHENHESQNNTLGNQLWELAGNIRRFSKTKLYSPAWHIWHSTRIEDITCSYFILEEDEVLYTSNFDKLLNLPFLHTGNSMNYQEMEVFNNNINIKELRKYREAVSNMTINAITNITAEKLKSNVMETGLNKISEKGSVIPEDKWLLEYWGKKKISGIVTMPLTRHLLVHLNSAIRNMKIK